MPKIAIDHFITLFPDVIPGHERVTTMRDVLLTMSAFDRDTFFQAAAESEYAATVQRLKEDFASVAYPEANVWPEPPRCAILDEIDVRIGAVSSILCKTDGRLYLRVLKDENPDPRTFAVPQLMTTSEFLFYKDTPIRKFVDTVLVPRATSMSRAVEVLKCHDAPQPWEVQYQDGGSEANVNTVILHVRSKSQIEQWARRRLFRILDANPKDQSDHSQSDS